MNSFADFSVIESFEISSKSRRLITKALINSHRQCPKRAWLEANGYETAPMSMGDRATIAQGKMVHECGQFMYPGATKINNTLLLVDAAKETDKVLKSDDGVLFGACFVSESMGVGVRIDVVETGLNGLEITEISSGGDVKSSYLDDCAIDVACLQDIGVRVGDVYIMHPHTKIALTEGGKGFEVLSKVNVTNEVKERAVVAVNWIDQCANTLASKIPDCEVGDHCKSPRGCPFLGQCAKQVEAKDKDLVDYLPSKKGAVKELILSGVRRISEMPAKAMTDKRNALVREAILQGRGLVRSDIAEYIRALPYPRNFLDFEAVSFAIPRFVGMYPYQSIPYQWSLHTKNSIDGDLLHSEFIDVSGKDPRKHFVEYLLKSVGRSGPIFVYSPYEKTKLKELASTFSEYKEAIESVIDRLVDLLPLARQGYYHPDMCGSWSIKKIQPTLPFCKDLVAYSELGDVADGQAAQAAYMDQIDESIVGVQKLLQLKNMLLYCGSDTRVLVHFVDYIENAEDFVLPILH